MKQFGIALCALVALASSQDESTRAGGGADAAGPDERLAQPQGREAGDDAHHRLYRPDQVQWKDGPPSLPPGEKFAVLEGTHRSRDSLPCGCACRTATVSRRTGTRWLSA